MNKEEKLFSSKSQWEKFCLLKYEKKIPVIPKVKFFKNSIFSHQDSRRGLIGLFGNLKFVNDSKQIKIINITKKSVKKEIIGNQACP